MIKNKYKTKIKKEARAPKEVISFSPGKNDF